MHPQDQYSPVTSSVVLRMMGRNAPSASLLMTQN